MNASELVLGLYFIDSFPLLSNVALVFICLLCYFVEQVVDVAELARACFYVGAGLSRIDPIRYDLFPINYSFAVLAEVTLVANEDDGDCWLLLFAHTLILVVVVDNALHKVVFPHVYSFVAFYVGEVEYNDAAVSSSIKRIAQTLKAFLAGRVPNLQRHSFAVLYFDFLLDKISANCCFLR